MGRIYTRLFEVFFLVRLVPILNRKCIRFILCLFVKEWEGGDKRQDTLKRKGRFRYITFAFMSNVE